MKLYKLPAFLIFFLLFFFGEITTTFSYKGTSDKYITNTEIVPLSHKLENEISENDDSFKLDSLLEEFINSRHIKGASVAIAKDNKLVYAKGFGYANEESDKLVEPKSLFRIASVSKLITAVGIMKLYEEGRLDLNSRVFGKNGILNDSLFLNYSDKRIENITISHLLYHTSGWNGKKGDPIFNSLYIARKMGITPPAKIDDIISFQLREKLDNTPGAKYSYSNFGYALLGRVIEKVSKISYEEYIQFSILHPLGIYDMHIGGNFFEEKFPDEVKYYELDKKITCYAFNGSGEKVDQTYGGNNIQLLGAAGGWVASAPELLKLIISIDGFPDYPDILTNESIQLMTNTKKPSQSLIGWRGSDNHGTWWRTGTLSGTTALVMRHKNKIDWVVLLNTTTKDRSKIHNEISRTMFKALNSVKKWPEKDLFNIGQGKSNFAIIPSTGSKELMVENTNFYQTIQNFTIYDD